MHENKVQRILKIAVMAAMLAAVALAPAPALCSTVIDVYPEGEYTPKNPVQDNITRLNVNKLEKGARDHVKGAHMAIYEKETGKLVTEWVTDGSVHEVARNAEGTSLDGALNIDTVCILRELEAPEGYAKAEDVEFVIHSDDFNTTGELLSGTENGNADSEEIHGSGPKQAFVINLYDEATLTTEEVEQRRRERNNEEEDQTETGNNTSGGTSTRTTRTTRTVTTRTTTDSDTSGSRRGNGEGLSQTSDTTDYVPAMALTVVGVGVIAAAVIIRKRRG